MVLLDVDGVLTDGRIIFSSEGTEYKVFDVHDGYGITRAMDNGLRFALISGRRSRVTSFRAMRLGIREVHQGADDKVAVFEKLRKVYNLDDDEVCFIGDDEFDLPLLRRVGLSIAPKNAVQVVRREVDYVTTMRGGRGAVREVLDMILRAKKTIR